MGMTQSPSLGANFFLGSSRLLTFLYSWRGPHVQLRSCAMPPLYEVAFLSQTCAWGEAGRAEHGRLPEELILTHAKASLVHARGCLWQQSCLPTCSLSSLNHVWDLLTGSSCGPSPRHISASRISCGFPSVEWQYLSHCTQERYSLEHFKLPVRAHEPGNTIFLSLTFCFCLFGCFAAMAAPSYRCSQLLNVWRVG